MTVSLEFFFLTESTVELLLVEDLVVVVVVIVGFDVRFEDVVALLVTPLDAEEAPRPEVDQGDQADQGQNDEDHTQSSHLGA